jgi:hypothetical protein
MVLSPEFRYVNRAALLETSPRRPTSHVHILGGNLLADNREIPTQYARLGNHPLRSPLPSVLYFRVAGARFAVKRNLNILRIPSKIGAVQVGMHQYNVASGN